MLLLYVFHMSIKVMNRPLINISCDLFSFGCLDIGSDLEDNLNLNMEPKA